MQTHALLNLVRTSLDERKALETQDTDALNAIISSKSASAEKLNSLDEKRALLCQQCGFRAGADQMQHLIDWCDEDRLQVSGMCTES